MAEDRSNSTARNSAAKPRAKRKFRSKLERRKIAEEALRAGASVAEVARAHGVRPNQVRHWRNLYCHGLLEESGCTALVPVTITDSAAKRGSWTTAHSATESIPGLQTPASGRIRIETGKARICVEGAPESACLRLVLEYLLG